MTVEQPHWYNQLQATHPNHIDKSKDLRLEAETQVIDLCFLLCIVESSIGSQQSEKWPFQSWFIVRSNMQSWVYDILPTSDLLTFFFLKIKSNQLQLLQLQFLPPALFSLSSVCFPSLFHPCVPLIFFPLFPPVSLPFFLLFFFVPFITISHHTPVLPTPFHCSEVGTQDCVCVRVCVCCQVNWWQSISIWATAQYNYRGILRITLTGHCVHVCVSSWYLSMVTLSGFLSLQPPALQTSLVSIFSLSQHLFLSCY